MRKVAVIFLLFFLLSFSLVFAENAIRVEEKRPSPPSCCCVLKHKIVVKEGLLLGEKFGPGTLKVGVQSPECLSCPFKPTGLRRIARTPLWAGICLIDSLITVSETIRWVAGIFSLFSLVVVGIVYMTAAGDEKRMKLARGMLYSSILGIVIIFLSLFIPAIARYFVGI